MTPEAPGQQTPEPAAAERDYARPPGWRGRMMATNPEQARRWMRWAWFSGLAWWVWTMVVLMVWISAPALAESEAEGAVPSIPPANLLIYYGVEGLAIALLALGVMRRWRPTALLLATGFVVSRVALIMLGLITLDGARDVIWLAIYGLLLFAFVRGAQGAFSYHWFTHPPEPGRRQAAE